MKRAVRQHGPDGQQVSLDSARGCALALLARSIGFGHRRLAVLRLAGAVQLGAAVSDEHWRYCEAVALECGDPVLSSLYQDAASRAQRELVR